MPSINNLAATTELEAINAMLSAIGEAPISQATLDLAAGSRPVDVDKAVSVLRDTARDTQLDGWRFNTEFGTEVARTAQLSWVDTAGVTTLLNIFKKPAGVLRWSTTKTAAQAFLDLGERPSKRYLETGLPVLVLYDRALNRDGLDAARFPKLYLDTVSVFDFSMLPALARSFIVITAARLFAKHVLGGADASGFTADDEQRAKQRLIDEEGVDEQHNIFDNADVARFLGGRPRSTGYRLSPHASPGPV